MKNKVVVITGASGGIGEAMVKQFAKAGYNIVYHYNKRFNEELVNQIAQHTAILPVKANLANPTEIDDMVLKIKQVFGKVDVLVNNAGVSQTRLFEDEEYATINHVINVDLTGSMYLTNRLLRFMGYGASIINISSIWGEVGGSMEVVYSAAKAGLIGFTKALSKELGYKGIRVNAITPGFIDTKMNGHLSKIDKLTFAATEVSLGKIGLPNDVANMAMYLASNKAKYITGQVIGVNGGMN